MFKSVFLHGRFVDQCTCDKCKRVIYITDSVNQRIKFARSHTRGKEDYRRINKERANVYDVWSCEDNEHVYSLCYPCLIKVRDTCGFRGMDVVDNVKNCFYTEILDDKIFVDQPDLWYEEYAH